MESIRRLESVLVEPLIADLDLAGLEFAESLMTTGVLDVGNAFYTADSFSDPILMGIEVQFRLCVFIFSEVAETGFGRFEILHGMS